MSINDRVKIVDPYNPHWSKLGTIRTIYETADVAIVELDSGDITKVGVRGLEKVEPETNTQPSEPTVTREQFREAVAKALNPNRYKGDSEEIDSGAIMISLSGVFVCSQVEKFLFGSDSDA